MIQLNSRDTLTKTDLIIHKRMLERLEEAREIAQRAQVLDARANELASGWKIWAEDMHERYGLDANRGEGVSKDGNIIRVEAHSAI